MMVAGVPTGVCGKKQCSVPLKALKGFKDWVRTDKIQTDKVQTDRVQTNRVQTDRVQADRALIDRPDR